MYIDNLVAHDSFNIPLFTGASLIIIAIKSTALIEIWSVLFQLTAVKAM